MKKLLLLLLLSPVIGMAQTNIANLPMWLGNNNTTKLVGTVGGISKSIWADSIVRNAVKYTDSAFMLSGYARSGVSYTKAQEDSRFAPLSHTQALATILQSGATSGQVPQWNGSGWVPVTLSGSGGTAIDTSGLGARLTTNTNATNANVATNTTAIALKLSIANYIVRETPSGTVNGTNTVFTLAFTPVSGREMVFQDGLLQDPTSDYAISGATITFTLAPSSGTKIRTTYIK